MGDRLDQAVHQHQTIPHPGDQRVPTQRSPDRLAAWWHDEPTAVPGVAAGPSGLVLVDVDAHHENLPADLATGLLPGIDLAAEPIPRQRWDDPARFRDGRDTLRLLAAVRGGRCPWPAGPGHRPVTVATPSGGRHLWYQAPAPGLRQALADPDGRHGLAWQVDIKAGWSYGLAPGAIARAGRYQVLVTDTWLCVSHGTAAEVMAAAHMVRAWPIPPAPPLLSGPGRLARALRVTCRPSRA